MDFEAFVQRCLLPKPGTLMTFVLDHNRYDCFVKRWIRSIEGKENEEMEQHVLIDISLRERRTVFEGKREEQKCTWNVHVLSPKGITVHELDDVEIWTLVMVRRPVMMGTVMFLIIGIGGVLAVASELSGRVKRGWRFLKDRIAG